METTIPHPEMQEALPGYAQLVLVPVANPATAADLLHLAGALVDPKAGKIIALSVVEDAEAQAKSVDEINTIVRRIREEGYSIDHKTAVSVSISRGIIDTVREVAPDLLIIGIKQNKRGQVELGIVAQNLLETAPCDVLVYRAARTPEFSRVVIPVGNPDETRIAAGIGVQLGGFFRTKIEAIRVQGGSTAQFEGLALIEEALSEVHNGENIKRTVVTANNAANAILTRTGEDDLIVVGFSERSEIERVMFGDVSEALLSKADGPVIMIARSLARQSKTQRLQQRIINWFRPALTRTEQEDIIRQSDRESRLDIDFIALIVASAAIATLGLMLNSAAVIIGAMLVAPLMSPLIAFSAGLTVGRVRIAWRSLFTILIGVGVALMVAFITGWLFPLLPTAEMKARGYPTLLDAGVAFTSGAIGAYATARKDIPAALAGVAIAAALMPPLCTVGVAAAIGETQLAFGAMVLFLTNILWIMTAAIMVFVYLGMTFRRYDDVSIRMQIITVGLLLLALVPIVYELYTLTLEVNTERQVRNEIVLELPDYAELVDVEFGRTNITRISRVTAIIRTSGDLDPSFTSRVVDRVRDKLGDDVRLELVLMPTIRVPQLDETD